jgi:threonine synthase
MSQLVCERCGAHPGPGPASPIRCHCGGLYDLEHQVAADQAPRLRQRFDERRCAEHAPESSGVWRYRELVLPEALDHEIVTQGEGHTRLLPVPRLADYVGVAKLYIKHEGDNPTGSFKDRGMTVALTAARRAGGRMVACASTGNTAASLAAYAAIAQIPAVLFVPAQGVALGKLAQSMAYGARVLKIRGDFDAAMQLVEEASNRLGLSLVNSLNPYRIEGQKTILWETLDQLDRVPDWFIAPAGNLGNTAAFGKAIREWRALGLIERAPRLGAVQAAGAAPFAAAFERGFDRLEPVQAQTVATAIRIGNPVSYARAVRALRETDGVALAVSDGEILAAKAAVDQAGIGAEPASCASVAGAKALRRRGAISPQATVVCLLTGHLLKDPETTLAYCEGRLDGAPPPRPSPVLEPTLEAVRRALA